MWPPCGLGASRVYRHDTWRPNRRRVVGRAVSGPLSPRAYLRGDGSPSLPSSPAHSAIFASTLCELLLVLLRRTSPPEPVSSGEPRGATEGSLRRSFEVSAHRSNLLSFLAFFVFILGTVDLLMYFLSSFFLSLDLRERVESVKAVFR